MRRPAVAWRLRRDPLLVAMVATIAGVVGAVGAINVVEVFFIRETLGSSTTMYGLVTGSWTLGILGGAWLFARLARRLTDDGTLLGAYLALLAGCCLMVLVSAAVPAALLLVPIWLIGGLATAAPTSSTTCCWPGGCRRRRAAGRTPPSAAAVQGAAMAGYLLGGLLLEVADPRPLVAGCGVAGLLVVAAVVVPVRRAVRAERSAVRSAAPHPAVPTDRPNPWSRSPPPPGRPGARTPRRNGPAALTSAGWARSPVRSWPLLDRPAEPSAGGGDTVGSWLTASPAPGSGTSSS